MPTYSYQCEACKHALETEQRISDQPLRKCPRCGKSKLRRMINSGGNFILKGGGWYSDGYGASKSSSKGKDGSSGPASSSEGSPSTTPPPSSTTE